MIFIACVRLCFRTEVSARNQERQWSNVATLRDACYKEYSHKLVLASAVSEILWTLNPGHCLSNYKDFL
jgi:hypothetical protein